MNVRRLIPTAAVAGISALGLLTVSACSGAGAADGKSGDKLDVVASFYPMQYLAEQIGGKHVNVESLTKPGVEPHDLEISPQQTGRLGESDVVLYLKGLQPAVDEAVGQSGAKDPVDAAELTSLEKHGAGDGHDHGEEGHEDEGHGHEDEGAHEGEEHDHDHGDENAADPHVWLDPVKYGEIAEGVGKALAKADPDNSAYYEKNAEKLTDRLTALDKEFKDGLKDTRTKTFITTHTAFSYLAERYGLEQVGIAGVDPESEPSPARMKELQKIAREDKVSTIFFETLASDRTAKTLASDTGLKTDVLDPLEGINDDSRGDDYFGVMRANLASLEKSLGAK
ncbi:High-affinity zinc uptake system binding-protein ZnuA precursor [Streptomyces sp. YIM 130001]|uniref:metal ABC transporter substrate-binding protein n=1 Tax=Streptomyces sp. YIM 130001 TaxID=2259644 RepID=UPI000E646C28|nr:metal ABC transporter substrate-binding protein [Streptomyces sp. YIM 130001]RII17232.1 High-affinity zinc uptake system binding-protein ZnuA precursor [Streptomyces sp. YIM 130001]